MSQSQPLQPNLQPDEEQGIPAADPGPGAPPTAPGFGEGYQPADYDDEEAAQREDSDDVGERVGADEGSGQDNPFTPPDPDDVGR